jgi:hypothetical protein
VPILGNSLVIVGTDTAGLLHIRIFDAGGNRATDTDETQLTGTQAEAISALKQQLPGLLSPHVLTSAEKAQVLQEVTSIFSQTQQGSPGWSVVTVRTFGDAVSEPAAALRKPGLVYKQPPRDLPDEVLPLLRRIDERLKERGGRLLIVLDQFEEFLVFHEREPERQSPLRRVLADVDRAPLNAFGCCFPFGRITRKISPGLACRPCTKTGTGLRSMRSRSRRPATSSGTGSAARASGRNCSPRWSSTPRTWTRCAARCGRSS